MGKARRVMRCFHCGAVFQSEKKNGIGYIEPELLAEEGAENRVLYCHNCYEKVKAINTGMLETDTDDEILKILDDAVATDALIIWVVDLFNFNGTLNPLIVKKIKKLQVIVIGTKFDLFSRKFSYDHMKDFVKARFLEAGIRPISIRLVGNTEKIEQSELLQKLDEYRQGHDTYMIGSITCGKTSIINRMLKGFSNKTKRTVKTECYPGTSVKVLEVPLSNSSFFYELPGFSLNTSVVGKVEKDTRAFIVPKKQLEMHRIVVDEGDTMVVGSLAAFSLIKGKITSFHFWGAEGIETRKVKSEKLDEFLRINAIKRSLRPWSERFTNFSDYDVFEYTMENDGLDHDIAITGLGWMTFEGKGQIIRVTFPKGAALKETLSKVGR